MSSARKKLIWAGVVVLWLVGAGTALYLLQPPALDFQEDARSRVADLLPEMEIDQVFDEEAGEWFSPEVVFLLSGPESERQILEIRERADEMGYTYQGFMNDTPAEVSRVFSVELTEDRTTIRIGHGTDGQLRASVTRTPRYVFGVAVP